MKTRVLILTCLPLFLTACATETVVEKPVVVPVVETKWRAIPSDLTRRCPKSVIPATATYGEVIELWSKDRAAIDTCNGRLAGVESLGGSDDGD